jgi:hypothetical protein
MWLKIEPENDTAFLTWGNDDGPFPGKYKIGLATVRHAASKVRQQLRALARWGINADSAQLPQILHDLAATGYELHYSLFESPGNEGLVGEVKQWMRDQREGGDHVLRVTTDPQIHIPWGLVFEHKPSDEVAARCSMDDFSDFWCLKYSLSATPSGYKSKQKLVTPLERCQLLSLINREVVDEVRGGQGETGAAFNTLLERRPIGAAEDYANCEKLICEADPGDTILHFFGHQHDGELDLGNNRKVSLFDFKLLLDQVTSKGGGTSQARGLVFLSACDGAVGDSDYSFITAANRPGICGLISTESAVPRDYAAKFSLRFLNILLGAGVSVGESMDALRHDRTMWPLSLLYGCYAQPNYRLAAASANPARPG